MSYVLESIKQVRWPVFQGGTGDFVLIVNRPGTTDLVVPATDTLLLSRTTDEATGDYSPYIESDLSFSKKFVSASGDRAIDDLAIDIRDSLGYSGTVNGAPVAEKFFATFDTFFDIFFSDSGPYRAFIQYSDSAAATTRIGHEGWIDPSYLPTKNLEVWNQGTTEQVWLGSRTIKVTAFNQAQLSLTWGDVLQTIGAADCQEGTPYSGFMPASNATNQNKTNTRADMFSSAQGALLQAVPFWDFGNGNANPVAVRCPAAVWPASPWATMGDNVIVYLSITNGGTGYSTGASFVTIDGGTPGGAEYVVLAVNSGAGNSISALQQVASGKGYSPGSHTTTTVSGPGSGLIVDITKVGTGSAWGPSGMIFISVQTLYDKIAGVLGLSTSTIVSALDYFAQKANNTDKNFPIDTTPIDISNLYVSLNVFAKSHPYDGSWWDNPVGWSPDAKLTQVLNDLTDNILSNFNSEFEDDGTGTLVVTRMGDSLGSVPASFEYIGSPDEDDTGTAPRTANVKYRADDLVIQAPFGIVGDGDQHELPIRIRRIAQTGGSNAMPDKDCLTWDASLKGDGLEASQMWKCHLVVWFDLNNQNAPVPNPDVWKSLCHLFWFNASNTNVVYPSNWSAFPNNDGSAGTWANSFYVVNAVYAHGQTPPADLQATVNGTDYFDLRRYAAVAFAALTLPLDMVQTVFYFGLADDSGSMQAIAPGLTGTWKFRRNPNQAWRAFEVSQTARDGITTIKFQGQVGNGFPALNDVAYGVVGGGGTSSSTGSGTSSGNAPSTTSTATFQPDTNIEITGAGVQSMNSANCSYYCGDATTTGVSVSFGTPANTLTITNNTGGDWTAGDFFIPNGATWLCVYRKDGVSFDPVVKTGWIALRDR